MTVTLTLPNPLAVLDLLYKGQWDLCEGKSRRRVGGPLPLFTPRLSNIWCVIWFQTLCSLSPISVPLPFWSLRVDPSSPRLPTVVQALVPPFTPTPLPGFLPDLPQAFSRYKPVPASPLLKAPSHSRMS